MAIILDEQGNNVLDEQSNNLLDELADAVRKILALLGVGSG